MGLPVKRRAKIIVGGLVQGVGFRYFVFNEAKSLGLNGYVKNLYNGDVEAIVEGEEEKIKALYEKMKIGPRAAIIRQHSICWEDYLGEFKNFEIKY